MIIEHCKIILLTMIYIILSRIKQCNSLRHLFFGLLSDVMLKWCLPHNCKEYFPVCKIHQGLIIFLLGLKMQSIR